MGGRDSLLPFDDIQPFPFMQDPPSPYQSFNLFNTATPNPHLGQNPSPCSPRNLHQSSDSSSGSSSLNQNHPAENPGLQEIESAMGGLRLSENPYRLITAAAGPYASSPATDQSYLREMRIRDAVQATMGAQGFNNYNYNHYPYGKGLGYSGFVDHIRTMMNVQQSSWRMQLVSMARDGHGCRVLQAKIKEGRPEEIELILTGLQNHLHELIIHPHGNYVIEKIFQERSVSLEQVDSVLVLLIRDVHKLQSVCKDVHGTRVIQKILEKLNTYPQKHVLTQVLKLVTNTLMKNVNGRYVIQQCIKIFPTEFKKILLDEIARNCVDIAVDRCGSAAIQNCLGHAQGPAMWLLVQEIILNAAFLSQDPYGNYLVQYLIKMELKEPPANKLMIKQLSGEYVRLSMDKHASNVMEHLLQFAEQSDVAVMVEEMMNNPAFLSVIKDRYGNYVVQRAMECIQGNLRKTLCYFIQSNCASLHSHPYGKNVFRFARKCMDHV